MCIRDRYLIATVDNLNWLSQSSGEWGVGKYYRQTANIDATGTDAWDGGKGLSPIGNSSSNFKGVYDGGGHVIDGLVIDRSSEEYVGMFGYTRSAVIKNLGVGQREHQGRGESGWPCGFGLHIDDHGMFHEGKCGFIRYVYWWDRRKLLRHVD